MNLYFDIVIWREVLAAKFKLLIMDPKNIDRVVLELHGQLDFIPATELPANAVVVRLAGVESTATNDAQVSAMQKALLDNGKVLGLLMMFIRPEFLDVVGQAVLNSALPENTGLIVTLCRNSIQQLGLSNDALADHAEWFAMSNTFVSRQAMDLVEQFTIFLSPVFSKQQATLVH